MLVGALKGVHATAQPPDQLMQTRPCVSDAFILGSLFEAIVRERGELVINLASAHLFKALERREPVQRELDRAVPLVQA